jgi:hypothetical protein
MEYQCGIRRCFQALLRSEKIETRKIMQNYNYIYTVYTVRPARLWLAYLPRKFRGTGIYIHPHPSSAVSPVASHLCLCTWIPNWPGNWNVGSRGHYSSLLLSALSVQTRCTFCNKATRQPRQGRSISRPQVKLEAR